MCVAVALCAAMPAAAAAELVDTVATSKPRAELSEFLVKKAETAAQKRDYGRAIVLYQALVAARGPGSPEARKLATIWTLAAQSADAAKVLEDFATATADAKARAEARAEATRLSANPDPFSRQLELPPMPAEAKQAFKLGRAAFAKKQWGDALVYFHMGYALAPDLPGFLRELGATYEKLDARDKKVDFYRAYLLKRPFGKNADEVRRELARDRNALGTLTLDSSLPCEEVWVNRQPVPGKLPLKKVLVAPGTYKAFCLSRKYEIGIFEYVTVTAGQHATLTFNWAIIVNQLANPYGRIAIENPKAAGTLLDLGVSSPEIGVVLAGDGRALKMVVKDDSGSRVEERSVRIRPGERFVVKW
jgi:tetratricopeptide (TPR) repeat protein